MFRKTILALTAVAALAATSLAPTTASAKSWKVGFGGFHGHHHHFNRGYWGPSFVAAPAYFGGCYTVKRWVDTPWGPKLRRIPVCG